MGTGIGKAISGLAVGSQEYDPEIKHEIIMLEKPIIPFFSNMCIKKGIGVHIEPTRDVIREKILESDLIQIEWFNHPLSYKFLNEFPRFPVRSTVWYHVNGCNHPYLNPNFIPIPNRFIFTGAYSYDNPYWTKDQKVKVRESVPLVNSSGGLEGFEDRQLVEHQGFNVGYYGTCDYAKLNSQFVEFCASVSDIPGIRFTIVGPEYKSEKLKSDIIKFGMEGKITIMGFLEDPTQELSKFDVAAYLLNPYVFDTTENALIEQMSMGIVPIVFDQCSEKYIIEDGITGFTIKTKEEFKNVIWDVYNKYVSKEKIGQQAKYYVCSTFTRKNMVEKMHKIYRNIIYSESAHPLDFRKIIGETPHDWFNSCLAPDPDAFNREVMLGDTKQSPRQFLKYFPHDEKLKQMCYDKNI